MENSATKVIHLLCQGFNEKFNDFSGIYLCGIFLDGKEHKGEDIELVAIFEHENKEKRQSIWPIIGKIETDLDVCIDLYPMTMDELKKDKDFYVEVTSHGVFYNAFAEKIGKFN